MRAVLYIVQYVWCDASGRRAGEWSGPMPMILARRRSRSRCRVTGHSGAKNAIGPLRPLPRHRSAPSSVILLCESPSGRGPARACLLLLFFGRSIVMLITESTHTHGERPRAFLFSRVRSRNGSSYFQPTSSARSSAVEK